MQKKHEAQVRGKVMLLDEDTKRRLSKIIGLINSASITVQLAQAEFAELNAAVVSEENKQKMVERGETK